MGWTDDATMELNITFKVVIDGVSYEQDVTSCATGDPPNNVAQTLYDMLKNY